MAYKGAKALIQFDAAAALRKAKELKRTRLESSAAANREIAAARSVLEDRCFLSVCYRKADYGWNPKNSPQRGQFRPLQAAPRGTP
jgi:hypothetical protein